VSQGSFFSQDELDAMSSGYVPPPPKNYVLPTRFPNLSRASRIAWDWETKDPKIGDLGNGVYRKDGRIVGGAIAAWDKEGKLFHAEYYPFAHRNGPNLDEKNVIRYFQDQLNFFEGELVGANLLYDGDWGQSVGIVPAFAKWRDVQWAEALIDEMSFTYRLEHLGKKYVGLGKVTAGLKELYGPDYIKRFDEVHPGHAREYGLGDVLLPNAILKEQYKVLDDLGLRDLFELESRLTPFLLYLRRQGVRVSMDRATEFGRTLTEKRDAKLKELCDLTGVHWTPDNFGTPKFLDYVFQKLNIKPPRTKKGDVSVTDKWLKNLDHPMGKLLEAANKYDKAQSVFVQSYVFDYAVGDRIHGEFHPLRKADENEEYGTESGRFSGSHPNLQNIPARDEEIGPMCRSMFIPEEGAEWWSLDYSQIEYRFLVHMASIMPVLKGEGEAAVRRRKSLESVQAVIKLYQEKPDTDFHQALADLVTKVLGREFKRKDAKNLNFGLVYGMGLLKLAQDLNMLGPDGKPNEHVKPLMETYHGAAPFVKDLYDLCIHNAATKGEIRTILNRRSQFDFWQPRWRAKDKVYGELPYIQAINTYGFDLERCQTHKALNRLLQGSAADMMKAAMVRAWESGVFSSTKDFTCSLTVHDELDGSIFPSRRGKEAYDELQHIMSNALPLNLPVLVGAGLGADWSEAK
jgi:DNA polymerase I-like protein with 3'-5' exonuclease and polymerase domains